MVEDEYNINKGVFAMLVMFRFKNYGPFKDEVVFDMRAIKSYKEHPYNLIIQDKSDDLLKIASIYGANASGKTSFMHAYRYFRDITCNSFQKNNKDKTESFLKQKFSPFLFDESSYDENTEFEAIYRVNDYEYKYGFIYNANEIVYEWLYRTSINSNRQSIIFERDADKIALGSSVKKTCEKYVSNIDSDVLALSFFSSLKLRTHSFTDVIDCIVSILPISFSCDGQSNFMLDLYFQQSFNEQEKPKLLSFLNAIDVGIKDVEVEKNKKDVVVYTYHTDKENNRYKVPLDIESDGTKRAIATYSLFRSAVIFDKGLILDEFNNQLHPLLQKYLINLFNEGSTKAQLIYTTHDTTLLDRQFMRRDQIWFVNKNEFGESSVYSLAEYKIRNDKSFGKDYLGGIYGGIPILKDFSFKEEN